jgi:thiol-disulfide isomerase/thioredoxin
MFAALEETVMSRLLRLAFIPVLLSLAFIQADEDGWQEMDRPGIKFSIQDTTGAKLTEKSLDGKIVVVDFWATWCGPCVGELPQIEKFSASVKGRKDVAFLSFSVDDEKADVAKFFKDRKETFPVYMAGTLSDRMDVMIFPTKLILDFRHGGSGRIKLKKEGVVEAGELENRVAELLKKP